MNSVILKVFSYNGNFNRKEYLLFGFLVPIILIALVGGLINLVQPIMGESTSIIAIIALLIVFSIVISSTVKRARATGSSISLIMIIWVLFTPIAMLYLIFSDNSNNTKENSSVLTIPLVILVVVILGILVAVAIPKIQETKQAAQIEKEQTKLQ